MMIPLDYKADVTGISNAFRAACDDDTRNVMNVMANQTTDSLESLKFFVVTKSWFLKAWPILMAKPSEYNDVLNEYGGENWKEYIGRIQNAELVLVNNNTLIEPSESDRPIEMTNADDEKDVNKGGEQFKINYKSNHIDHNSNNGSKNRDGNSLSAADKSKLNVDQFHRRMVENAQTRRKIKSGMIHTRDYFFLGPSSWLLVKEKFGYDGYEICRCCKKVISSQEAAGQWIEVALLPEEKNNNHAMPTSAFNSNNNQEDVANRLTSTILPPSGRFPYEKVITATDNNDKVIEMKTIDREEEIDNVISWSDGGNQKEEKDEKEPPVLLLPPSTTYTNFQNNISNGDNINPLYTPIDDNASMDVESNGNANSTNCLTQVSGRKRLASGLGNMGNTCFMNSTLQCLAHTEPIRKYFLSGEYKKDLNRDNPLGTGGELATQFANLMGEMWGVPSKRRNVLGGTHSWNNTNQYSATSVYPRNFKNSLGKHAEQFMGYDQHDSQELATYLLDALHEDTNHVTKKPYIEKPEQRENESDACAASTAWALHLKREDSRVLDNFMGQVKSRLQCCHEGCDRVSTTFDPFMYLSVPIPGESEKIMVVTFVPLNPTRRMQKFTLTLAKTSTIAGLLEKLNEELVKTGNCMESIPLHDLCSVDINNNKIFKWYQNEDTIEVIKDYDETRIYQLRPLEEVQKIMSEEDEEINFLSNGSCTSSNRRVKLDESTITELHKKHRWKDELEKYSSMYSSAIVRLLHVKRSSTEEKFEFYEKLESFLKNCYTALEKDESSGLKRTREEENGYCDNKNMEMHHVYSENSGGDIIQGLVDCESALFVGVKTRYDVGVLGFCSIQLRQFIVDQMRDIKEKHKNGVIVQFGFKQIPSFSTYNIRRRDLLTPPLVLRLTGNSSVYSLREVLARRLSRSLCKEKTLESTMQPTTPGESPTETSRKVPDETESECHRLHNLRNTSLTFSKEGCTTYYSYDNKTLGMLEISKNDAHENGDKTQVAIPSNEKEQVLIYDVLGNRDIVYLNFEQDDDCKLFDEKEFELVEVPEDNDVNLSKEDDPDITVLDCIEKYCQKEKLDESEKWYCNKCKNHVRAWKQFHLYRAPPILIVHLKRFFFSASTHRRDKITKKIDFPLKGLDLTELVSEFSEADKPIYDCYAVSNHFGGLGGGHYTAFILSDDGTWCDYDDSHVTTNINQEKVVSDAAYVLYYRRRDVPFGQDRDVIVQTPLSPMICVQTDVTRASSELSTSSSNIAQVGDMDLTLDDMDNSNRSSRTAVSPIESMDNSDQNLTNNSNGFAEFVGGDENFPGENDLPLLQ